MIIHDQIEYLEDTDGTPTVELHVDLNTIAAVDMKCRGSKYEGTMVVISTWQFIPGSRCCSIKQCSLMEGDCTADKECENGEE